jgi:Ca-activated chloride channel family protein
VISDFHFLRPEWLWALLAAAGLLWVITRREDLRTRWQHIIAPHLLEHLLVEKKSRWRLRPVHLTAALIALGCIAAAGPTWQHEQPPFVEDKAPLAIVIDLSPTMDAIDITPTRLERTKLKVRDLLALRQGARTAIFVYAGSAHRVLPLTDDTALIQTYVDSLAINIMPTLETQNSKNTTKALQLATAGLAHETIPGTILFMTDGIEASAFETFKQYNGNNALMVLGIGTAEGAPVKTGKDTFLSDANGQRVFSRLDTEALRRLKNDTPVSVATVTLDDSDVQWIQHNIQTHLQQKQMTSDLRWRDMGWYLTLPIALLSVLWFRRGWTIRWISVLLLGFTLTTPDSANAADWHLANAWLTADQQGQLAYLRGDYAAAAQHFTDPMWQGIALYRAGHYDEAVDAFSRIDSAESYYNQGNALAHAGLLPAAVASYQAALKRKPDWVEAKKNLALVQALIPPVDPDEQQANEPNMAPDQIQFDDKGKQGKRGQINLAQENAEMWMRNIQTTPAQLLQRKFQLEAQKAAP